VKKDFHSPNSTREKKFHRTVPRKVEVARFYGGVVQPAKATRQAIHPAKEAIGVIQPTGSSRVVSTPCGRGNIDKWETCRDNKEEEGFIK
jgi:hypothetical protein